MKDVLDAYAQRDVERALDVWERDADLDALEDSVFRDLLTHMMEDPRNITFSRSSSVLLEEHRADRRSRDQHRRNRGLSGDRFDAADRAAARPARDGYRGRRAEGRSNESDAQGHRPSWGRLRAAHPDRRGRSGSVFAARLQSRGGRLCGRERRARRRGRTAARRKCARPRDPRLDAARRLGPRNLPPLARARIDPHAAGHHGDGARRRG